MFTSPSQKWKDRLSRPLVEVVFSLIYNVHMQIPVSLQKKLVEILV